MEGKLIKTEGNYILENEEGVVITSTSLKKEGLSLSIKNCEAIKNGFDLEKLIEDRWNELSEGLNLSIRDKAMWCGGFRHGITDKKFSEEDMISFFKWAYQQVRIEGGDETGVELLQKWKSLQQTEWDVSFNSEEKDSEGCFILKRI